jgi:hypothetical protein
MSSRSRIPFLVLPVIVIVAGGIHLFSPAAGAQRGQGTAGAPERSDSAQPASPPASQENQPAPQNQPASPTNQPAAAQTKVIDAYNFAYPDSKDPSHDTAEIDDIVVLKVEALGALVNQSRCVDEQNNPVPNCEERDILLFLERRQFPGNTVEALDVNSGELQFHLRRTQENNEKWSDLLGNPPMDHRFFERPTAISVGLAGGSPVPSDVKDFKLVRISRAWLWVATIGSVLMLAALIQLAIKSDILRDAGDPTLDPKGKPLPKAYSLSRFQMAFWFVLVIASYVFIWLITDATDTLNTSVLALIGIGSGTALGSFAVDANKEQAAPSDGFLQDILSDATGICFYRFQMFVWTLVLGMIFLSSVWYSLSMPEFSATLLALQGISAGTYLGFKIPEKPDAKAGAAVPASQPASGNGLDPAASQPAG